MSRRLIASLLLAASVSACVAPMPVARTLPMSDIVQQIETNPALAHQISLGTVSVTDYAAKNSVILVSDETFREALNATLLSGGLAVRGSNEGAYLLDAKMTDFALDSDFLGFTMDNRCAVEYRLTRRADGKEIYHDTIRQTGHAGFADAPDAHARAVESFALSLRENMTHLLRIFAQLNLPAPKVAAKSAPATPI